MPHGAQNERARAPASWMRAAARAGLDRGAKRAARQEMATGEPAATVLSRSSMLGHEKNRLGVAV